jgi:1A family penicillin-binding protein
MNQPQFSQIFTQAVQTIQAQVNSALALKPGARVPELWIQDADAPKAEVYPLIGDRYLIGRSSKSCDVVIRNPVISQIHASLERDRAHPNTFILKDENSTNGIYRGRRKLKTLPLRHGDVLTLGPPELAAAVRVKYHNPPPPAVKGLRYTLYGAGGLVGALVLWMGVEWTKYPINPIPPSEAGPVTVLSEDDQLLRPQRTENHTELDSLSEFSPYLPQAVLASEDSRYYWHLGVDPIGILRAILVNFRAAQFREGASTITQQLARSLFTEVGRDVSPGRKLREMVVALKLETFYSKDHILLTYLNRVYLGVGLAGFEDAAQFYFNKPASELTLSEAATLAGILPAPNSYNPVVDYDQAVSRRNRVISRMQAMGMISAEEADRARRSRIEVSPEARDEASQTVAPYYYDYVLQELNALLGDEVAREGNFIIETGLDVSMQRQAEASLASTLGSSPRIAQGAIVTLDTENGVIRAMVGGADYRESQFNRALAERQPGSTFKVFAYAAALEQGISPFRSYSCAPVTWQGQRYKPCERSSGSVDMFRGLAQSENNIALRVAQDVGLKNVVEMAKRLGIRTDLRSVPGLVLGQSEVKALEITGAYAAFANNGVWNDPHAITRILDAGDCEDINNRETCRVIYDFTASAQANVQVLEPRVANLMTQMLRGVIQGGTGGGATIGLDAVGKTGTTNDGVDLWFIGYVPVRDIVTGIWLGNDNNDPTRSGSAQAAQLWGQYMGQVLQ